MDGGREWRREGCTWMDCSSLRRIAARWFSELRKVKKGRRVLVQGKGRRGQDDASDCNVVAEISCSKNSLKGGGSLFESCDTGLHKSDMSINVGLGCCLLYLIAAGNNELRKMVELQSEMQKFLEKAKEEKQRKERLQSKPLELNDLSAYSTTDVGDGPDSSSYHLSPRFVSTSLSLQESSMSIVYDLSSQRVVSKEEPCLGGMDVLEAELEAELELLQLRLDPKKKLSRHPKQERLKIDVKDIASVGSRGEGIEPQEDISEEQYGVSPYELERRLHELLESRQQEQIRELEIALECAKHELHEKEMEVSWWKETAYLFSQRIPESSRLNLKHSSETHPLSRRE